MAAMKAWRRNGGGETGGHQRLKQRRKKNVALAA